MSDKEMTMEEMKAKMAQMEIDAKKKDEELDRLKAVETAKTEKDAEKKKKEELEAEMDELNACPKAWANKLGKKIDISNIFKNPYIIVHDVKGSLWRFQVGYTLVRPDGTTKEHLKNMCPNFNKDEEPDKKNQEFSRFYTWMYNHGLFGPESTHGEGLGGGGADNEHKEKKVDRTYNSPKSMKKEVVKQLYDDVVIVGANKLFKEVKEVVPAGGAGAQEETPKKPKKSLADVLHQRSEKEKEKK